MNNFLKASQFNFAVTEYNKVAVQDFIAQSKYLQTFNYFKDNVNTISNVLPYFSSNIQKQVVAHSRAYAHSFAYAYATYFLAQEQRQVLAVAQDVKDVLQSQGLSKDFESILFLKQFYEYEEFVLNEKIDLDQSSFVDFWRYTSDLKSQLESCKSSNYSSILQARLDSVQLNSSVIEQYKNNILKLYLAISEIRFTLGGNDSGIIIDTDLSAEQSDLLIDLNFNKADFTIINRINYFCSSKALVSKFNYQWECARFKLKSLIESGKCSASAVEIYNEINALYKQITKADPKFKFFVPAEIAIYHIIKQFEKFQSLQKMYLVPKNWDPATGAPSKIIPLYDVANKPWQEASELYAEIKTAHGWAVDFNKSIYKLPTRPVLVTLTLPGEYHPNPKFGANSWNGKDLQEGWEVLNGQWLKMLKNCSKLANPIAHLKTATGADSLYSKGKLRGKVKANGLDLMGIKTGEPHPSDGTPHLHIILFMPDHIDYINLVKSLFIKYFPNLNNLPESGWFSLTKTDAELFENMSEAKLKEFEELGKSPAQAITSYICKYIFKNNVSNSKLQAVYDAYLNEDQNHKEVNSKLDKINQGIADSTKHLNLSFENPDTGETVVNFEQKSDTHINQKQSMDFDALDLLKDIQISSYKKVMRMRGYSFFGLPQGWKRLVQLTRKVLNNCKSNTEKQMLLKNKFIYFVSICDYVSAIKELFKLKHINSKAIVAIKDELFTETGSSYLKYVGIEFDNVSKDDVQLQSYKIFLFQQYKIIEKKELLEALDEYESNLTDVKYQNNIMNQIKSMLFESFQSYKDKVANIFNTRKSKAIPLTSNESKAFMFYRISSEVNGTYSRSGINTPNTFKNLLTRDKLLC